MATIKSYTDLEQSKKLAEILPLESADMCFANDGTAIKIDANPYNVRKHMWKDIQLIPCWSVAALLNVIRKTIGYTLYGVNNVYLFCNLGDKPWKLETEVYDNEVDACYEIITKLHELNLL